MKIKNIFKLIAIAIILGLKGCGDETEVTCLTVDYGKVSANGGTLFSIDWTVNISINGETMTVSAVRLSI